MFDQQDAHAFTLQLAQHGGQALFFLVAQASSGLVQQQQGRVAAQGARDFHQALRPHGQVASLFVQIGPHADALELARGLSLLGVTLGNFLAQRYLPLTVTGALMFTMPFMVTVLSVPMLGERIGWRRLAAIAVGFVGVLIIIRPGTEAFHPAALIALAGAVCAALYTIFTRKLAGVDSPATQQVFSGLIALTCVTPFAFEGWVWPSDGPTWFAFCLAGVGILVGCHGKVATAGGKLRMAALTPRALNVLKISKVDGILFLDPTVDASLAALAAS